MTLSSIIGAVALLSQLAIARPANQNQAKRQDIFDAPYDIFETFSVPEVQTLTITNYVDNEVTQTIVEVATVLTGSDVALSQLPTATVNELTDNWSLYTSFEGSVTTMAEPTLSEAETMPTASVDELTDTWSLYTSIEGSITTMVEPTPSEADIIFTPLPMPYGTHSSVFPTELPWCESVSTESVTQTIYIVMSNNITYTSTAATEYTETSPLPWDTVIDPYTSDIVTATNTDTDTWTTKVNTNLTFTPLPTKYSYSTQESWTSVPKSMEQPWTSWNNLTSAAISTKTTSMASMTATASAQNVTTITTGMTNMTNTASPYNLTSSTKTLHYTTVTWTVNNSATVTSPAAMTITTVVDGTTIVTVTPTTTKPPITLTLPDTTTTLHITSTVIDPGMPPQETPTIMSSATSSQFSIYPITTSAAAEGNVVTVTVDTNGQTLTNTVTSTTMKNSSSSATSMATTMTSNALSSINVVTVTATATNTLTTAVAAATPLCKALGSPRPGADTDGTLLGIYWYNRANEVVTLQGCYQLCLIGLAASRGCVAFEYYYYKSGGARCKMYGASVADTIANSTTAFIEGQTANNTEIGIWYDITCGDPFAGTPMAARVPVN